MPIGLVREGSTTFARPQRTTVTPTWSEQVRALAQVTVEHIVGVESSSRTLTPTLWTRWETAFDERVCPVCAPYAGRVWPIAEGPAPPLHPHCRCARRYAYTTWSVRDSS